MKGRCDEPSIDRMFGSDLTKKFKTQKKNPQKWEIWNCLRSLLGQCSLSEKKENLRKLEEKKRQETESSKEKGLSDEEDEEDEFEEEEEDEEEESDDEDESNQGTLHLSFMEFQDCSGMKIVELIAKRSELPISFNGDPEICCREGCEKRAEVSG